MALGGGFALVPLIVLGWASSSDPIPTPIRVTLDAPADCSTSDAFYQSVLARTDRVRLAAAGETSIELGVRLVRVGTKVHGELRMLGEHGESDTRQVDGASCDEVVEALSLTVALALVPTARVAPSEPEPPPPEPVPVPVPIVETPQEPPQRSLRADLGAHAMIGEVVSPDLGLGGALSLRFTLFPDAERGPSFGVTVLHLRNDLFSAAARASFRFTAVVLEACPTRFKLFENGTLEPCLLGAGGSLRGTGVGLAQVASVQRSYWGLGGALIARVPTSAEPGFGFEAALRVSVPLVERRFIATNPDRRLGETPLISALASLGVFWGF